MILVSGIPARGPASEGHISPKVVTNFVLASLALFTIAATTAGAERCTAAKLKAIGRKESGLLGCQAKVATTNDSSGLTDCETRVTTRFSTAFANAGSCVGDQVTCEDIADRCVMAVAAAMTDTFPSACEAAKRRAAGKLARTEFGCYSKAAARGAAVDTVSCIPRAQGKFSTAITRAGTCPDGGSPLDLVENNCVKPAVATDGGGMVTDVCPPTSTTTTTTTSSTTTTPQPCGGNPQTNPSCNGTCDPGMGCAFDARFGVCACFPSATCQASRCFSPENCLFEPCSPGYTCMIDGFGNAFCLAGECGSGCICPPGGVCVVFQ